MFSFCGIGLRTPCSRQFFTSANVLNIHRKHEPRFFRLTKWSANLNRPRARHPRQGGQHSQQPGWKRFLDSIPPNYLVLGILGINGGVYLAWNYAADKYRSGDASLLIKMNQNFPLSWANIEAGRLWTLLTCCFSHSGVGHIFVNAFTFWFMAPPVLGMIGNTSFLALYLGGGIVSAVSSLFTNQNVRQRGGASHGASGAIYAVVTFFACAAPRATFYLFAVLPMPAWALVTGIFVWDSLSAITDRQRGTDSSGHVGGMLAGAAYYFLRFRRMV